MSDFKGINEDIYKKYILDKISLKIPYGEKSRIAKATGYDSSNLSGYLAMKKSWDISRIKEFATHPKGIGMTEQEFNDLEIDARIYEFEKSTGKKIGESSEDIDYILGSVFDIHSPKAQKDAIKYLKFLSADEKK